MTESIIANGTPETTETLPPLEDVAHAQSGELLDVLTLLHYAINDANECTFPAEGVDDATEMTDRHSRFIALLDMTRVRVASVIMKFDPYI